MADNRHEAGVVEDEPKHKAPPSQRDAVQVLVVGFGLVVPVVHHEVVRNVVACYYQAKGL